MKNIAFKYYELSVSELLVDDMWVWGLWDGVQCYGLETYFVQSHVVKAWLSSMQKNTKMIFSLMMDSHKPVGVMILGRTQIPFLRYFSLKALTLMRSGATEIDQLWPEYVTPRCSVDYQSEICSWFEFVSKKANVSIVMAEVVLEEWSSNIAINSKNCAIYLDKMESGGRVVFVDHEKWSPSILRQIRQTESFAKTTLGGEIVIREAFLENKMAWLHKTRHWHQNKWFGTGTPSGFDSGVFCEVIEGLNRHSSMRVFGAFIDEKMLGTCIVLCSGKWAGFYLLSNKSYPSNHWHLGIWMHGKISELLSLEGYECYDFMAGDARYKRQMATVMKTYSRCMFVFGNRCLSRLICLLLNIRSSGNIIK
jgi:hypothetical protein